MTFSSPRGREVVVAREVRQSGPIRLLSPLSAMFRYDLRNAISYSSASMDFELEAYLERLRPHHRNRTYEELLKVN